MIYECPTSLMFDNIFLKLEGILFETSVNLKIEGFTSGGSIKAKAALHMVDMLERSGKLKKGGKLVESSSGNLGLALSLICAAKGYEFTCISDPNISPQTKQLICAYGANLIIVDKVDSNGGYLTTRINKIKEILESDKSIIWINQYENIHNVEAHYRTTAPSILQEFPVVDYLFVGAGTTGTLGGVSNYFKNFSPDTKIIAVDSIGSVTFGGSAGKRYIPGLGTSSTPPISDLSRFDHLIMVPEIESIKMCHLMASKGLLLGGSSGTVLSAISAYAECIPKGSTVVAISPDFGDRYVETIYNFDWINRNFPETALSLGVEQKILLGISDVYE